ncbi:unnamed protein product [Polarella glacialis]|nr:unnamed protein product [Polarella glacialis]
MIPVLGILSPETDQVQYTDSDGDLICFRLESGRLIKYVNGLRLCGADDSTGVITQLFVSGGLVGNRIDDQYSWGGGVPDVVLETLSALAERAGVLFHRQAPASVSESEGASVDREFINGDVASSDGHSEEAFLWEDDVDVA